MSQIFTSTEPMTLAEAKEQLAAAGYDCTAAPNEWDEILVRKDGKPAILLSAGPTHVAGEVKSRFDDSGLDAVELLKLTDDNGWG